jgi:hypothetical protein
MVLSIGFILSWIQNFEIFWNKKSNEQIFLKLTGQYGVQNYFFIKNFNELDLCEVIT